MMWLAIPVEYYINNLILFTVDFEMYVEFNHRAVVIWFNTLFIVYRKGGLGISCVS